jgi:hypothetical protein
MRQHRYFEIAPVAQVILFLGVTQPCWATAPDVRIVVNPASIPLGNSATLSWNSADTASCVASGDWTGTQGLNGTLGQSPSSVGTKTYTLTCTGTDGTVKAASATLTVTAGTAASPTTFPSSGQTFGPGDAFKPQECIKEFVLSEPTNDALNPTKYAVPPYQNITFWVDSQPDAKGYVAGHFVQYKGGLGFLGIPEKSTNVVTDKQGFCGGAELIKLNQRYLVNTGDLATYGKAQFGVTYGALTIPYKFHPSDGTLSAAPTVAPFAGWYVGSPGIQLAAILTAGLGSVPVSVTTNGGTSSVLKTCASVGGGFVVTLSKASRFQIGLLAGSDWAGSTTPAYKYNGKIWLALSFGVDLTK